MAMHRTTPKPNRTACPNKQAYEALLGGAFDESHFSEIESHLETCPACNALVASLLDTEEAHDRCWVEGLRAAREGESPGGSEMIPSWIRQAVRQTIQANPTSQGHTVAPYGDPESDRFRVVREDGKPVILGRGGMAVVYKAVATLLDREVALKIPKDEFAGDPDFRDRFLKEAQQAAKVCHIHVLQVFEAGETRDGRPYLTMKLLSGESLKDRLEQSKMMNHGGGLAPKEVARLVEQASRGLASAHQRGLVHRDVKPSNLLLDQDEVRLGDFGLARIVREKSEQLSHPGEVAGSRPYMSPEQYKDPDHVDARSDIWSMGVVLYELLTGECPFRGTEGALMRQILNDEPKSPRRVADGIARDLETITLKCLSKERDGRYQAAQDLANDLQAFLNGQAIMARPVGRSKRAWLWCRRNPVSAAATAAALLLLIVLATGGPLLSVNLNQQTKAAVQRREEVRQHLYAAELGGFSSAWFAGRGSESESIFEATKPKGNERDLRGWEWYHLYSTTKTEQVRFAGHAGPVTVTAVSGDGNTIASADDQGTIIVWDASNGAERARFLVGIEIFALAFNPAGSHLAIGSNSPNAFVLDLTTADVIPLTGHVLPIHAVSYSPDGATLATGSADNTIKIWDMASGEERHTLQGHTGGVRRLWFGADGSRLASYGDDASLRFWSLEAQRESRTPLAGVPLAICVNHDLSRIAVLHQDQGAIAVLQVQDLKRLSYIPGFASGIVDLCFSRDGNRLATADSDGDVAVFDLQLKTLVQRHRGAPMSIAFCRQDNSVVAACGGNILKVWDAYDNKRDDFKGHDGFVRCVRFQPGGDLIATGDAVGSIRLWNRQTKKHVATFGYHLSHKGPPGTPLPADEAAKAKNRIVKNETYFAPPADGNYAPDTLRRVTTFEGHAGAITSLAFSPDGHTLASSGEDVYVRLWDVRTGKEVKALRHPLQVSDLAFSPDGRLLVSSCWDDLVRVWDLEHSQVKPKELHGHIDNIDAVAFHPNGSHLATGGVDRVIRIWDLNTMTVQPLRGHEDHIHCLAFSPDGKLLASGGGDKSIRVWDFHSGRQVSVLRGHSQRVTKVAFHPTQNRLISASNHSADATIRIWDPQIGREIVSLPAPGIKVNDFAFGDGGATVAVTAKRQITLLHRLADLPPVMNRPSRQPTRKVAIAPTESLLALGYLHLGKLPKLHAPESDQFEPRMGKAFLVVVLSARHEDLYPSPKQLRDLGTLAEPDDPLHPRQSCAVYDSRRYALILKDGAMIPAIAIGPLPHAMFLAERGGFDSKGIIEGTTAVFKETDRALFAVAWDLDPDNLASPMRLRIDDKSEVQIPLLELHNYKGQPQGGGADPDALLVVQKTYFKLEELDDTELDDTEVDDTE